jgi:hypothetical protein
MKNLLLAILLTGSAFAADAESTDQRIARIMEEAQMKRFDGFLRLNREYRAAVSTTFKLADRVEVYLLDFAAGYDPEYRPKEDEKTFPIRPYDKETGILKTHKVAAQDVQKWCAAVTKLLVSEKSGVGMNCHFPIHGIRIFSGDTLLFETSLCWKCGNYYFHYRTGASWEGLALNAEDLKALLDRAMPIPESERLRMPGEKPNAK